MKKVLSRLFLIVVLTTASNTFAQETKIKSKCVSGNCNKGFGRVEFSNGEYYEGEFVGKKFNGKGVYHYANGDIYDGYWIDNFRSGTGTYSATLVSDSALLEYDGGWYNGLLDGKGTVTYMNVKDKKVNSFELKDGVYEGKEIVYYHSDLTVTFNVSEIINKKVEISKGNNEPQKAPGDICAIYNELCELKSTGFASIKGELIPDNTDIKTKKFSTTKKLPLSTESYIEENKGLEYIAVFGKFEKLEDAQNEFNTITTLLKNGTKNKIFKASEYKVNEYYTLQNKYPDGFDTEGDVLSFWRYKGIYTVGLRIKAELSEYNHRMYYINEKNGSGDSAFDTSLHEFIGYAKSYFSAIYGTKHEETFTNLFNQKTTIFWYDIIKPLSGVTNLKFSGVHLSGDIYKGVDEIEATAALTKWFEKTKKSLGSGYCYFKVLKNDGKYIEFIFGDPSKMSFEKNTEVIKIIYNKNYSNPAEYNVSINIGFDKFY